MSLPSLSLVMGSWGAGRLPVAVAMPMVALITIGSRGAFAVLGTGVLVILPQDIRLIQCIGVLLPCWEPVCWSWQRGSRTQRTPSMQ